jgi:DNA repair photolyase
MEDKHAIKGRGAQLNTSNRFLKEERKNEHLEGIDEVISPSSKTIFLEDFPKKIVNTVKSPYVPIEYSMNPYQGCEHGCIYCYARNTHEYWGYSAGLDFEQKIIVKPNAPQLLEKQLRQKNWQVAPIMLSGNTDCYQPIERKLQLTRKLLEVLLKFKHPVGIITKNSLILRDKDVLEEMAKLNLVHVMVSITSLNEDIRLAMEPRTTTALQRLKVINELNKSGIPCGIMTAPIIPGINSAEIPELIKNAAENGAKHAGYTIIRLSGSGEKVFTDWLQLHFPDRAEKVINQIESIYNGKNLSNRSMVSKSNTADAIKQLFNLSVKKHIPLNRNFKYNLSAFCVPPKVNDQLNLF